ncbi:hypothetical protein CHISP_3761 [Chitinispirillum alkaliphilum]|nr:hypothetical protein CHISP_3761 [Chitinispirillum alkaliphilum]
MSLAELSAAAARIILNPLSISFTFNNYTFKNTSTIPIRKSECSLRLGAQDRQCERKVREKPESRSQSPLQGI